MYPCQREEPGAARPENIGPAEAPRYYGSTSFQGFFMLKIIQNRLYVFQRRAIMRIPSHSPAQFSVVLQDNLDGGTITYSTVRYKVTAAERSTAERRALEQRSPRRTLEHVVG